MNEMRGILDECKGVNVEDPSSWILCQRILEKDSSQNKFTIDDSRNKQCFSPLSNILFTLYYRHLVSIIAYGFYTLY